MANKNQPVGIDGLSFERITGGFKVCGTVEVAGESMPVCQKVTDAQILAFFRKASQDTKDEIERFIRRGGVRGVYARLIGDEEIEANAKRAAKLKAKGKK